MVAMSYDILMEMMIMVFVEFQLERSTDDKKTDLNDCLCMMERLKNSE